MLLHSDPDLAEAPGFDSEQLDSLARSIELRRQQLETDIGDYIQRKQDELRRYEQQLLAYYRPSDDGDEPAPRCPAHRPETDDRAKKTKHTRVHKRERELYGLVTPVFLPLLDAHPTSPPTPQREKKPKQEPKQEPAGDAVRTPIAPPARDGDRGKEHVKSRSPATDMSTPSAPADPARKARRPPTKKSALRTTNTPRPRCKRVSLVIDDQIVLPADSIVEHALASPSETTSASNSTTSFDECIDPRLTHIEALAHDTLRRDAVHHSLPLTMTHHNSSPTKALHTLPSAPMSLEADSPPLFMRAPYEPTPARIDELPEDTYYPDSSSIPEEGFSTYVGGISGSGASDLNQTGSYGYPSSLGASYLESYMLSRPLSVRMAAADKAGLDKEEKRAMLEKKNNNDDDDDEFEMGNGGMERGRGADDDDDDFMGSMDDF